MAYQPQWGFPTNPTNQIILVGLVAAAGLLTWYLLDKPVKRIRRRRYARKMDLDTEHLAADRYYGRNYGYA